MRYYFYAGIIYVITNNHNIKCDHIYKVNLCKLNYLRVIQDNSDGDQAVLIIKQETTLYNFFEATADEHECYGFVIKPSEEAAHLYVTDATVRDIVV